MDKITPRKQTIQPVAEVEKYSENEHRVSSTEPERGGGPRMASYDGLPDDVVLKREPIATWRLSLILLWCDDALPLLGFNRLTGALVLVWAYSYRSWIPPSLQRCSLLSRTSFTNIKKRHGCSFLTRSHTLVRRKLSISTSIRSVEEATVRIDLY